MTLARLAKSSSPTSNWHPPRLGPGNVIVPKGHTGCNPGQTTLFQTLQIKTKIAHGQIEMTTDTHLTKKRQRIQAFKSALP